MVTHDANVAAIAGRQLQLTGGKVVAPTSDDATVNYRRV